MLGFQMLLGGTEDERFMLDFQMLLGGTEDEKFAVDFQKEKWTKKRSVQLNGGL